MTAAQRRAAVTYVQETAAAQGRPVSQRRACRWLGVHRTPIRYVTRRAPDTELRGRLRELAAAHPRWGVPRLYWLLRREGRPDNYKRVERLYREEGLAVPKRRCMRVAQARVPRPVPGGPNVRWGMDFVRDTLSTGRAFRALTVVDTCTREALAIEVDVGLTGERVAQVLDRLGAARGWPAGIVCDHGPEFRSRALEVWATARGVALEFIRPGKSVTTPSARVSTAGFVTSASTRTGSSASATPGAPSRAGASLTTPRGPTTPWAGARRPPTPPSSRPPRTPNYQPQIGPETGLPSPAVAVRRATTADTDRTHGAPP